mmetsp:Transcript_106584/g.281109  ORF Transcript_106584/g.281109 Transcript_106584/m.281109 type:complete len:266 (+) Transcript_106584:645-1442(+)
MDIEIVDKGEAAVQARRHEEGPELEGVVRDGAQARASNESGKEKTHENHLVSVRGMLFPIFWRKVPAFRQKPGDDSTNGQAQVRARSSHVGRANDVSAPRRAEPVLKTAAKGQEVRAEKAVAAQDYRTGHDEREYHEGRRVRRLANLKRRLGDEQAAQGRPDDEVKNEQRRRWHIPRLVSKLAEPDRRGRARDVADVVCELRKCHSVDHSSANRQSKTAHVHAELLSAVDAHRIQYVKPFRERGAEMPAVERFAYRTQRLVTDHH